MTWSRPAIKNFVLIIDLRVEKTFVFYAENFSQLTN